MEEAKPLDPDEQVSLLAHVYAHGGSQEMKAGIQERRVEPVIFFILHQFVRKGHLPQGFMVALPDPSDSAEGGSKHQAKILQVSVEFISRYLCRASHPHFA
jgi:hypothetical protein